MPANNSCSVTGRVISVSELRHTNTDKRPVLNIIMSFVDPKSGSVVYTHVVLWDALAGRAEREIHPGMGVHVVGRLVNSYRRGDRRLAVEAESFERTATEDDTPTEQVRV